ncbi:MAG: hypothetical protein ACR9NN_01320 [Nostochopsis sp.]
MTLQLTIELPEGVFNPAMADYWLGRALAGLGDRLEPPTRALQGRAL